jgi:hypothetical protein
MSMFGATSLNESLTTKVGNPPGEAIRGPARPSIAFDPSERLKPTDCVEKL